MPPLVVGTVGNLAEPNVPEAILSAFKSVRAEPLRAGSVAGNLASGKVPEATLLAFKFVKFAPETCGNVPVKDPKSVDETISTLKSEDPSQKTVVFAPCVI